jgi:hypothetical protein
MSVTIEHETPLRSISVVPSKENSNNISVEKRAPPLSQMKNSMSIDDFSGGNIGNSGAELGLDYLANETKRIKEDSEDGENEHGNSVSEESINRYNGDYGEGSYADDDYLDDEAPRLTYEEMQQQKAYYLSQLNRLEKKGNILSRRFGPEHSLEEIKSEVFRIRKEKELENGIEYCKQGLMFFVTTIEMANERFDPFGAKLSGWSNSVMATQDSYDDVFEELYEKYNTKLAVAPEIKLISMIAGSAFMFHLQKSLVDKAMNSGDVMGSLASMFNRGGEGGGGDRRNNSRQQEFNKEEMKGPSINTDELLRKLNADDISDISSIRSDESELLPDKSITVQVPKKRGRKPKKMQ